MCISGSTLIASSYGYTFGSNDHGENWFYLNDLTGGGIFSLYARDSLVIAGGVNEIFKSIDYGNNFTSIPLSFSFGIVNIYTVVELNSAFYLGTSYDGVYKSTDNCSTWTTTNHGMGPKDVRSLAVTNSSTLIAGTEYIGVFRSINGADSWSKSMSGLPVGSSVGGILCEGDYIFAGTRGDGIHRSTNHGDSWVKLQSNIDTLIYSTIQGFCEKDSIIYAAPRLQFSSTVYKSDDYGDSWVRCGNGLPPNLSFITNLATSGNNIVASTDEGIYYSPDDGSNWFLSNLTGEYIPSMVASGGFLFAADPGTAIYLSNNNGVTWVPSLVGPVDWVEVAAVDNYAFAGTFFNGARYSYNTGNTWFTSSGFANDASIFAIQPVGRELIIAGTDQDPNWIYASFDNGTTYSPYSEGLRASASIETFAVNDTFMFAGTNYNGVWRRLRPGVASINTKNEIPLVFELKQNYPNPFNPSTTINYTIPNAGNIKITVFNVLGEIVSTLVDDYKQSGNYKTIFNSSEISNGVYFYKLNFENLEQVRKMILLK